MRKAELREPIHLNSSNRGRLRKVQYHRVQPTKEETSLLLTPNHLVVNVNSKKEAKQKHLFYFRKQQHKDRYSQIDDPKAASNEDSSEMFRAIHTASPYHSLRKVPLRSITPIRTHRKEFFSNQKVSRFSVEGEAGMLRQEILSRKLKEMKNAQLNKTSEIVAAAPEIVPRYSEYEGDQEFYQYRQRKSPLPGLKKGQEDERHKIAGTRIEPFKKYQIRQIHKNSYSHRNYEYPLIISQ